MAYQDHDPAPPSPADPLQLDPALVPATEAELVTIAGDVQRWAVKCLTDPGSPHTGWTPHLLVMARTPGGGDPTLLVMSILVPFNTDDEKRAAMLMLGRKLYADRVVPAGAVFTSEAWSARMKVGDAHVQPKDHPDREEILVVIGASLGNKVTVSARMPVTRGPGDVMVPGEWEPVRTGGPVSRLFGWLWAGYFETVLAKFGPPAGGRDE